MLSVVPELILPCSSRGLDTIKAAVVEVSTTGDRIQSCRLFGPQFIPKFVSIVAPPLSLGMTIYQRLHGVAIRPAWHVEEKRRLSESNIIPGNRREELFHLRTQQQQRLLAPLWVHTRPAGNNSEPPSTRLRSGNTRNTLTRNLAHFIQPCTSTLRETWL